MDNLIPIVSHKLISRECSNESLGCRDSTTHYKHGFRKVGVGGTEIFFELHSYHYKETTASEALFMVLNKELLVDNPVADQIRHRNEDKLQAAYLASI